jgi:hypothetical protein
MPPKIKTTTLVPMIALLMFFLPMSLTTLPTAEPINRPGWNVRRSAGDPIRSDLPMQLISLVAALDERTMEFEPGKPLQYPLCHGLSLPIRSNAICVSLTRWDRRRRKGPITVPASTGSFCIKVRKPPPAKS